MRIGELARRTGATRRALRLYESHGLLTAERAANGYRHYDEAAARQVANIRRLQTVGFTLAEIADFHPCLGGELTAVCPASTRTIARKLAAVQEELDALTVLRDRLADLLDHAAEPAGSR
ncbi:MerR family transcriptional regulator [Actinocatenispora sera]|uniref:HTH merR-type domain-containing protein n=1 Tax=Actinocatenispora sera TaxID=390989 RepID=A0A810KVQ3_9ACTN|nr:MerR family transcriptional regulator [Actinocatenispora sera]BCJ26755.1 hypothetical protein Asera_08630 [Actinocatenispora sera]